MKSQGMVRRLIVVAWVAVVAGCQDGAAPTGIAPASPALSRASAQDRLEDLFQRTSPEVMSLPGTVFADNDEVAGKLVFGVEDRSAAFGVATALQRLGVSGADYAIELTQPIEFMATLRDRFTPAVAGIQINFGNYVCSIGFNADLGGERSFVTASHCTGRQGGVEGTLYYQPLKSSYPAAIATEVSDPQYYKGGNCPKGKKCRYSDAARAAYDANTSATRGVIANTSGVNNGSITVTGASSFFNVNGEANGAAVGDYVNKVGRTTGRTRGRVTRSCVNTSVTGSTVYLLCQTFVSDPGGAVVVRGGDSGSGVFTDPDGSNNVTAVGILWGGSSDNKTFVFSPLSQVKQELGALTFTK